MNNLKGVRICLPHKCNFEDIVELGPNGHCKTVYVPLCDNCKKEGASFNVGKIKQFTGDDVYNERTKKY